MAAHERRLSAYTAASPTFFSSVLKVTQLNISGSATATGGLPPNIDFYLLLDSSPSMAIAATTAGMQTLVANTQSQTDGNSAKGCAFACHESQPSKDSLGNPGGVDNYTYAKNTLGLTLRIDLVQAAAKNLMSSAQTTMANTTSAYRMAIYTFDIAVNTIQKLTSNLTTAANSTSNIQLLEVCYNNHVSCSSSSTRYDNDMDTDFDQAMSTINTTMPDPGSGTNTTGDTPQEVLFLVTDGVEDAYECTSTKNSYTNGGCREQWYMNYPNASGNTYSAPGGSDWCTTIKNRGIRIAVLYTTYVPMISPPLERNYTSSWVCRTLAATGTASRPSLVRLPIRPRHRCSPAPRPVCSTKCKPTAT